MTFIPSFRHFRIYNIISLTGTAYTAIYLMVTACKYLLPSSSLHMFGTCSQIHLRCIFLPMDLYLLAAQHSLSLAWHLPAL